MHNIESHFPFPQIREAQREALNALQKALVEDDKKFFIVDAETGVGKSAIAVAASGYLNALPSKNTMLKRRGSYFLTTQKILQDQYERDFSKSQGMLSIRSSSNFRCQGTKGISCAEGMRILKAGNTGTKHHSICTRNCIYKKHKREFIDGDLGVTNYSYFLAETYYSGQLEEKRVLVIDEAHNLVSELSKFVEIAVTERFAKQALKLDFPGKLTQAAAIKWIKETYMPKAKTRLARLQSDVKTLIGSASRLAQFEKIASQIELLDKHVCKINRFLETYDKDNWVFDFVPADGRSLAKFEFKPIDVSDFATEMVFNRADKIVLMSATIISKEKFCQLLGIKPEQAGYIKLDSPFPLENRPVAFSGVGKMNASNINNTLPKMAQAVQMILDAHPGEKGIIHAHSYKVANFIMNNVRSSRLLTHDSSNRDDVLQQHMSSKEATVLVSPSMQEGVDLRDDLSRFQVLCKVPFPYLGDKLIKKRMYKWKWWYDYETTKTIVQSVGRSVRNEADFAVTYILDEDWHRFASKNVNMLPENLAATIK